MGQESWLGVPQSCQILSSWSKSDDPVRMGFRKNISPRTQLRKACQIHHLTFNHLSNATYPTPQISTSPPYCLAPNKSSGGLYHRVTTQFVYFLCCSGGRLAMSRTRFGSNARARPKSAIISEPVFEISKFAAFMSRCKMWFWATIGFSYTTVQHSGLEMTYPVHVFGPFEQLFHV